MKRTLRLLKSYPWPGYIRELQNVIERSVILCESEIFSIDESWLPQQSLGAVEPEPPAEFQEKLLAQQKNMIEAALKECEGRVCGPNGREIGHAAIDAGIEDSLSQNRQKTL